MLPTTWSVTNLENLDVKRYKKDLKIFKGLIQGLKYVKVIKGNHILESQSCESM
jgi:hypothetical protein